MRVFTLNHNCHNVISESCCAPEVDDDGHECTGAPGLSKPVGVDAVLEMNRLGMIVDLSHASTATALDVLNVSHAPVIFSHSASQDLCNHERNVPTSLLDDIKRNGGVVMVPFYKPFLCRSDINAVVEHVRRTHHLNVIRYFTHISRHTLTAS